MINRELETTLLPLNRNEPQVEAARMEEGAPECTVRYSFTLPETAHPSNEELEYKKEKRKKRLAILTKFITTLLVCGCTYVSFLIYGVAVTSFIDAEGEVAPLTMSMQERAAASEFHKVMGFYLRARDLYEHTLHLNYQLASDPQRALLIASEYDALLDDVAKLSVDVNAAQFSSTYNQIHRQLLYWVQTDIAVYLQNMSAAIAYNDMDKGTKAIISRDIMYNDFGLISENLATYGNMVKGANVQEIYRWSPEGYIAEIEDKGEFG